jgi:hypothetical protein
MVYFKSYSVGSAVPTKLAAAQPAHAGALSQPDINIHTPELAACTRKYASFSKRETLEGAFLSAHNAKKSARQLIKNNLNAMLIRGARNNADGWSLSH